LNQLVKRYYNSNKPVTFTPSKGAYADSVTWEKYSACLVHLNNFQPRIPFAEIDEILIARFKNYLANLKDRKGKMGSATNAAFSLLISAPH
jgi:hypothetical protein